MSAIRQITPETARRFIITKQHLTDEPKPAMLDVIRDLGCLQLDPIGKVLQPHWMILLSRLGNYDRAELEKLRWDDRALFEYWAHAASIVLAEDYPIHAVHMRKQREGEHAQKWLDEHNLHDLRAHVLKRLEKEGPMQPRDFDDGGSTAEQFSGWTSNNAINRLISFLWTNGEIMVSHRKGNGRTWDLTERVLPDWTPREELDEFEASYRSIQRAVKALGVTNGKKQIDYAFTRHRYWHYNKVMKQLLADGVLVPIEIPEWKGDWVMHHDDIPLLDKIEQGDFQPKTTLLSPFDPLICDRDRTELIWDFFYRIEIYVPKDKREYGYYVLPILHGDDIIGRMDLAYLKKPKILDVIATYAEDDAPADAVDDIRSAVETLGNFLGAKKITYGKTMPKIWKTLPK